MSYAVPRAVVEAFYKAYAARDAEKIAEFLDDDVEWTISGPVDYLRFCGTHRGKAAVLDLIGRQVPEVLRVFSFVPDAILVDGDQVAMLSRQSAKRTDDGRVISYRVANFMRFRDGKVIENLSLLDSFDAVEQVLGHPLVRWLAAIGGQAISSPCERRAPFDRLIAIVLLFGMTSALEIMPCIAPACRYRRLFLLTAAPAFALDLPTRKTGLWEIKMIFEGRNLPPTVMKQCVDPATDKLMNANFGGSNEQEACSKKDIKNSGGTITIDSVCKFGETTTTSHAVVSGSFDSAYTIKVASTRAGGPPLPGVAPGAETHMTIEAKWLGACAAGQSPATSSWRTA